ncbi:hypothetical protein DNTS_029096, partial [Danionella cerebrum]
RRVIKARANTGGFAALVQQLFILFLLGWSFALSEGDDDDCASLSAAVSETIYKPYNRRDTGIKNHSPLLDQLGRVGSTQDLRKVMVYSMKRLSTLSALKKSGFGQPSPRHGLRLIWWFVHECVHLENNGQISARCAPANGDFGFHRFHNYPPLLPRLHVPYYEVGNLKPIETLKKLPDYVRESYKGYESNCDRIIVSCDSWKMVDVVYVTKHSDHTNFDPNQTYEITTELLREIKRINLHTFLSSMRNDLTVYNFVPQNALTTSVSLWRSVYLEKRLRRFEGVKRGGDSNEDGTFRSSLVTENTSSVLKNIQSSSMVPGDCHEDSSSLRLRQEGEEPRDEAFPFTDRHDHQALLITHPAERGRAEALLRQRNVVEEEECSPDLIISTRGDSRPVRRKVCFYLVDRNNSLESSAAELFEYEIIQGLHLQGTEGLPRLTAMLRRLFGDRRSGKGGGYRRGTEALTWTAEGVCFGGVPIGTARTGGLPITGEEERGGVEQSLGVGDAVAVAAADDSSGAGEVVRSTQRDEEGGPTAFEEAETCPSWHCLHQRWQDPNPTRDESRTQPGLPRLVHLHQGRVGRMMKIYKLTDGSCTKSVIIELIDLILFLYQPFLPLQGAVIIKRL